MEPLTALSQEGAGGGEPPGGGPLWTAVFEYEACGEDELSLRPGDVVQVLSRDSQVSGDEGWWTGQIDQRVGIFPSNYVSSGVQGGGPELRARYPPPPAIQRKERGGGGAAGTGGRGCGERRGEARPSARTAPRGRPRERSARRFGAAPRGAAWGPFLSAARRSSVSQARQRGRRVRGYRRFPLLNTVLLWAINLHTAEASCGLRWLPFKNVLKERDVAVWEAVAFCNDPSLLVHYFPCS